jgi:hypothetical protein
MSIVLDGSNQTTGGLINAGTAVASTSGTAITFTGIPSTAKRITVMFNGVSTSGTSNLVVRIGSGSVVSSGYSSGVGRIAGSTSATSTETSGFMVAYIGASSNLQIGSMILNNLSGNLWVSQGSVFSSGYGNQYNNGLITLSGVLDRVIITTVNGTDTFASGSVNIFWE